MNKIRESGRNEVMLNRATSRGINAFVYAVILSIAISLAFSFIILLGSARASVSVDSLDIINDGRREVARIIPPGEEYGLIGTLATVAIALSVSLNTTSRERVGLVAGRVGRAKDVAVNYARSTHLRMVMIAQWALTQLISGFCLCILFANWGVGGKGGVAIGALGIWSFVLIESARSLDSISESFDGGVSARRGKEYPRKVAMARMDQDFINRTVSIWWALYFASLVAGSMTQSLLFYRGTWLIKIEGWEVWMEILSKLYASTILSFALLIISGSLVKEQIGGTRGAKIFWGVISELMVVLAGVLAATFWSEGNFRHGEIGANEVTLGLLGVVISGLSLIVLGTLQVLGIFGIGPFVAFQASTLHFSACVYSLGGRRGVRPKNIVRLRDLTHLRVTPAIIVGVLLVLIFLPSGGAPIEFAGIALLVSVIFVYIARVQSGAASWLSIFPVIANLIFATATLARGGNVGIFYFIAPMLVCLTVVAVINAAGDGLICRLGTIGIQRPGASKIFYELVDRCVLQWGLDAGARNFHGSQNVPFIETKRRCRCT